MAEQRKKTWWIDLIIAILSALGGVLYGASM